MKEGIILDVDGTLWDAVRAIRDSWNLYREEQIPEMPGQYTDADIEGVLGLTMTQIGDRLLAPLSEKRRHQALEGMMDAEVTYMWEHGGSVYPSVGQTLTRLKKAGFHLYIVSNCQKGYIEDFLHTSGTGSLIGDHVCFGDTGKPKDFSIRLCMERNELQRALYVGDTAGDLDAARKAGIPFIYAAYGFGQVDAEKEKVPSIDAFAQLPEMVTALWEKAGNRR